MNAYGVRALIIGPPTSNFIGGPECVKNIGGLSYIGRVVVCFCLMSPLDIGTKKQQPEKVPNGHGRFYKSGPWQKQYSHSISFSSTERKLYIC